MKTEGREELRRRMAGWRAAERREQALRAEEGPVAPSAALAAATELYELYLERARPDTIRGKEEANARRVWMRLKSRLLAPPGARVV